MNNLFNTFPQDGELMDRTVRIINNAEPTTVRDSVSAAKELLEEAKMRAAEIVEAAKAEAAEEVENAKRMGFRDGIVSAVKKFSQLLEEREKGVKEARERALRAALEAAKQITGEIIKQDYQHIIADRIGQALALFALQDNVKIKLNDTDYKMLSGKFSELDIEHEQIITWQPTDSMPVGAFEISVDGCKLEASIEKQLDGFLVGADVCGVAGCSALAAVPSRCATGYPTHIGPED